MIKGRVQAVTENKAGYWAIKVGDKWYGTGQKKKPACEQGDTVEFDWYLKDEKYLQVKGSIKAAAGGGDDGGEDEPRGKFGSYRGGYKAAGGGSRDGYWKEKETRDAAKEPRIAYQGAFERGLQLFQIALAAGAYGDLSKITAAKRLGAIRDLVRAEADFVFALSWNATPPEAPEIVKAPPAKAAKDEAQDEPEGEEAGWSDDE